MLDMKPAQALANQTKFVERLAAATAVAAVSRQSTQQVMQLSFASATAAANPHIQQQID